MPMVYRWSTSVVVIMELSHRSKSMVKDCKMVPMRWMYLISEELYNDDDDDGDDDDGDDDESLRCNACR